MAITKVTSGVRTLGTGEVTTTNILDGTIENADVSATAAIASTELKTNKISPATGTALQIADSGDTITIPSGATIANSGTATGFAAGLNSVQSFTSSGTWTRPSGITKVIMEVQGAGGGGAGNDGTGYYCTGGGGGGYAKKFLDVSSISTSTITVGAAGSGGGSASNGGAGGATSWADGTNTITGNGGNAGVARTSNNVGEAGGSASGGDININGGYSIGVYHNQSLDRSYSAGASFLGNAGIGVTSGAEAGTGYGAGGGGVMASAGTGGAGAPGIVIVWEYK